MNIIKSLDTHWKGLVALSSLILAFLGTTVTIMNYLEGVIELKAAKAVNIEYVKKVESLENKINGIDKHLKFEFTSIQNKFLKNQDTLNKLKYIQPINNIDINIDFNLKNSQHLALSIFHQWGYSLDYQRYGNKLQKITKSVGIGEGKEKGVVILLDDKLPKEKSLQVIRHLYRGLKLPITHISKVRWIGNQEDRIYKYTVSVLALSNTKNIDKLSKLNKFQIDEVLLDLTNYKDKTSAYEKYIKYIMN